MPENSTSTGSTGSTGEASAPAPAPASASVSVSESVPAPVPVPASVPVPVPVPVTAPSAHVLAWTGLALVNAVAIGFLPVPAGGTWIRVLHHVYDAGHMIAIGLVASLLSAAWERFGPARPLVKYAALAALSAVIAVALLKRDLAGFAEQIAGESSAEPVAIGLAVIASLAVPGALALGARLAHGPFRAAGIALSLAGGAANAIFLQNDYPGVHFFLAWISASIAAGSITGIALPRRLRATSARSKIARRITFAAVAIASLGTIVRWPSNAVLIELYSLDSAVVLPILARARARASAGRAAIPPAMAPWFVDRSAAPDIPPSTPPLLAKDGVVVLLTIDSLRADVMASDSHRRLFPALFKLRDESVSFDRARSPGSGTRITLATVFSGKYFSQLHWTNPLENRPRLDRDRDVRFPELLVKAGAATVTYVSEAALESSVGIARGFTEEQRFQPSGGQRFALSRELMEAAIARLRSHRGGPLFLYMHLMDPHAPYDAAGTGGTPRERYLREIALVDKEVDRLLRALDETGLAANAAVVVTADHGEAFGQHNTPHHNTTLYEELLRVPLMIRAPGARPRRVMEPVSLVDLGPTVLDLMGVPTPGSFMGESLTPFLRGQDPKLTRPLVAERRYAQAMIFPDNTKVILDWKKGTEEIYDLERDPAETRNLCDELGPACAERLDVLRAFFLVHGRWR
jgi:hypothetical protein